MLATCFRPFRFGVWARLALVAFLAGEIGGGGFNLPGNRFNRHGGGAGIPPIFHGNVPWQALLWFGICAAVLVFVLFLVFAYLNARARFVLMDSAIERTCRLGDMWERWREPATGYFGFNIALTVIGFSMLVFMGLRILQALMRAGAFAGASPNIGLLISGLIGPIFIVLSVSLLLALANLFAKDFLVQVMGFEGRMVMDGWARLRGIMANEPAEFIVYVITKIVLSIVAWFVRVIFMVPVMIAVAIPVAVVIGIGVAISHGNPALSVLMAMVAVLFLAPLFLFIFAMINVPFAMFFESFALEFIGGRLPGLEAALHPMTPYAPVIPGASGTPVPAM
jgi:hypothetical protein